MEIAKTKEKIPEEERGLPRGWVERPVKGCSPPNEVARSPPDDAARRMHMAQNPRASVRCPVMLSSVAKTVEHQIRRSQSAGGGVSTGSGEAQSSDVGGPRTTREKKCSLQTRMPGRRVPGWTRAGHGSGVQP